ncbi:hypothetical protein F4808DRAFT_463956 [Astrocystis sublimbata]|nr:hypothetical protein F4808DRAFT_463956 [Astrocystis sublimbata]
MAPQSSHSKKNPKNAAKRTQAGAAKPESRPVEFASRYVSEREILEFCESQLRWIERIEGWFDTAGHSVHVAAHVIANVLALPFVLLISILRLIWYDVSKLILSRRVGKLGRTLRNGQIERH